MANIENPNLDLLSEREFKIKKSQFFWDLITKHLPEMRLLVTGGKLTKDAGWRNVAEHCLTQIAIADTLGDMLNLTAEEKHKLEVVAGCHDWSKRVEKKPSEFTEQELRQTRDLLAQAKPDPVLMATTGSTDSNLERMAGADATWLEKIQYYIDRITDESEIIDPIIRIERARSRHPELDDQFLNQEKELSQRFEAEIYQRLVKAGVDIESPKDVPLMIKQKIYERIMTSD